VGEGAARAAMGRALTTDRVAGAALTLFGLFVIWESRTLPLGTLRNPGPAFLPIGLALLVVGLGGVMVALGTRAPRLGGVGWPEWRHAVAIFAACGFAALALERIGYRPTVTIALLFLVGVVERKPVAVAVGMALGLALATFFLFNTVLRVPLPRGPLGL
jgi:hypothetical protein